MCKGREEIPDSIGPYQQRVSHPSINRVFDRVMQPAVDDAASQEAFHYSENFPSYERIGVGGLIHNCCLPRINHLKCVCVCVEHICYPSVSFVFLQTTSTINSSYHAKEETLQ